jgi:hypothetical protein
MLDLDDATGRTLRYVAARFFLGRIAAGEAIRTIETLMGGGIWRDEFFAILDSEPILREVSWPFERCLDALGVQVISIEQAVFLIVDHHTHEIATAVRPPWLSDLFDRDLDSGHSCEPWHRRLREVADACVLWDLYKKSDYFLFDDDDDWPSIGARDKALEAHQSNIISEAIRWQTANSRWQTSEA